MNIGKNAFTLTVLLEIDFNKMGKQFLTHISNEIRFPNLTGTIDEKNLVAFFLEEMLQDTVNLRKSIGVTMKVKKSG